jgi:hypothetical protein
VIFSVSKMDNEGGDDGTSGEKITAGERKKDQKEDFWGIVGFFLFVNFLNFSRFFFWVGGPKPISVQKSCDFRSPSRLHM